MAVMRLHLCSLFPSLCSIPAHFCGIFGFKPTPTRVTLKGSVAPHPHGVGGQQTILSTLGPMGRCTDDLELVMRCWCSGSEMYSKDFSIPPVPWDHNKYLGLLPPATATDGAAASAAGGAGVAAAGGAAAAPVAPASAEPRKLRYGILRKDGFFEPSPPSKRALELAVQGEVEVREWP